MRGLWDVAEVFSLSGLVVVRNMFGHAFEHLLMDQPPWLMQVADDAIRGDPSTVESVCSVG